MREVDKFWYQISSGLHRSASTKLGIQRIQACTR